jgi:hypothetical protein
MRNRRFGVFLSGIILVLTALPVLAQSSASASLSSPIMRDFPRIEAYLQVKDESGHFVTNLDASQLTAIEDNQPLPVNELWLERPGAQFVVALNPGPSFALRNSQGSSRSSFIQRALVAWAVNRRGSDIDDLSLLTTNGAETSHVSEPLAWSKAITLEEIDARQAVPSMDTLFRAVEIAADPSPRTGMGRAVLFITTPLEDQNEVTIQNLIARAKSQGVSISIWMVPVPGAYYPNAEKQFQEITSQTGGQLFTYTDEQPGLEVEGLLEPFRPVYRFAYQSQIRASGSHQLAVDVQAPTVAATTPPVNFELNIEPPAPAFVSPPLEVLRLPPTDEAGKPIEDSPANDYQPDDQEIEVLVTFPDERPRDVVRTSLYVDGQLVQENRLPPFERFNWDLSAYDVTASHMLRVEAEDELGMVGSSIERLVQVTVEQPVFSPWSWVFRNAPTLSILGVVVAGAVLLLVLLLGGRLRPRQPGTMSAARRRSDPVTQPVPVKTEAPSQRVSGWANRLHWPQRNIPPQAYAFLSRITEVEPEAIATPMPITSGEITLGSDPNLATMVLNDPSVEGLHARLLRKEDGSFRLIDEGSIAGTWINYTPISREGAPLEHGDLIHIGRVGFRFTTRQPTQVRKAVATRVESNKESE